MTHLDLFSGIGGFALAAQEVWPDITHTFCEIDPFCQAVLRKHWPDAPIYDDIKELAGFLESWNNTDSLCQKHALIARMNRVPRIPIGGKNVLRRQPTTDSTEVQNAAKNTTRESGKSRQNCGEDLSKHMEESAPAAERMNRHSLPLTTSMAAARKKEKHCPVCNSIEAYETRATQADTDSSAITAITERIDSVYAHTRKIDIVTGGVPMSELLARGAATWDSRCSLALAADA